LSFLVVMILYNRLIKKSLKANDNIYDDDDDHDDDDDDDDDDDIILILFCS